MKKLYNFWLSSLFAFGSLYSYGQTGSSGYNLGKTDALLSDVKTQLSSALKKSSSKPFMNLKVSDQEDVSVRVNYRNSETNNHQYLTGELVGRNGSFFIRINGNSLEGNIIFKDNNTAFKYYSDNTGNAYVKSEDINKLLCINYNTMAASSTTTSSPVVPAAIGAAVSNLQSLPGAAGCVLLDFDGQYVSGTPWNNGNPINAAASGMSDDQIQQAWEVISEDYRPFNVNITTSESVFNSYPMNRRMRCIFTPTNTAAPGAGGVAYVGSFPWNDNTPCWVYILDGKNGGEAASHEIGHTMGLSHDGRNLSTGREEYYGGQGDWAPIMGVGYYKNITQWSKGEYQNANNKEDDLSIISGSNNGIGYRGDDYSNSTSGAAALGSGSVSKSGLIERNSDVDFFSINAGSGTISLNVNTVGRFGDLDILVKLYNSSGAVIGTYNPAGLNSSLSMSVSQGTYYLSVQGTGAGDPFTNGYSNYGSLGTYTVSGSIPVPTNVSTDGSIIVYKDCNFGGYAIGLNEGDYTLAQLKALGVNNDDISSLKVKLGFKIIGYADDNFSGASVTLTGDDACLVDNGWNDMISSVRVRANGVTSLAGTYYLQNRNSGLYLDVWGASTADGANIAQGTYNGGTNQQFTLTHLGDGVYKILAKHSGKSIDIADISTADGANVLQWPYWGGNNQKFIVQNDGSGFYKLIPKHSSKVIEVAGFSTANGGNVQQWTWKNQNSGEWKLVPVTTSSFSLLVQAENFSNMAGVQTESTADAGGGLNVGWIDAGDWMAYNNINFPSSGTYTVEYRVASQNGGGRLSCDLNAGSIQLGAIDVPSTGGWQNWTTITQTVTINAGTYNFGIYAQSGGWNLNWFRITKVGSAKTASSFIAEEDVNASGLEVYPNPVATQLNLKFASDLTGKQVKVISATGMEVMSTIASDNTIDVSSFENGIYTIVVNNNGHIVTKRFVKQ